MPSDKLPKSTPSVTYHTIDDERSGQRIDNFLQSLLKKCPKQRIYRLLRKGEVRVNSGRIAASYRLQVGDKVRVPPVRLDASDGVPASLSARQRTSLEKQIVFEDNTLLVINKPSGLAVHSGSGIKQGLIEQIRLLQPIYQKADLVHRLDRKTSGCVLVAKRRSMLRYLHAELAAGHVYKRYLVLVYGHWRPNKHQRCSARLLTEARQHGERVVQVTDQADIGKAAATRFQVLTNFGETATLVAAYPETGRTHQIRVHCAHLGHPVVGDDRYGNTAADSLLPFENCRLFLHAESIDFKASLESKQRRTFECPPDEEWNACLTMLDDMS